MAEEQPQQQPRYHCMYDGHAFDGKPYRIPVADLHVQPLAAGGRKGVAGRYKLQPFTFCSAACAKAHMRADVYDSHLLLLFSLYYKDVHGLDSVPTAPARERLAVFNVDNKGLSIAQFRAATPPPPMVPHTATVSPCVHVEEAQHNYVHINIEARAMAPGYKETVVTSLAPLADGDDEEENKAEE